MGIGIAGGVVCGLTLYLSIKSIEQLLYVTTGEKDLTKALQKDETTITSWLFFNFLATNNTDSAGHFLFFFTILEDKAAAQNILDLFVAEELPTREKIQEASHKATPEFQKTVEAFLYKSDSDLFDLSLFANALSNKRSRTSAYKPHNLEQERFDKACPTDKALMKIIALKIACFVMTKVFLIAAASITAIPFTTFLLISLTGGLITSALNQCTTYCRKQQTERTVPAQI